MSVQFSRSMRSLNLDSFRATRIAMILALLNMLALLAWFFLARVTLYENSPELSYKDNGRVVASFQPEAANRIRSGQSAILRLTPGKDQPVITLPALVVSALPGSRQIELLVVAGSEAEEVLQRGLPGQVEIEVEYVTPAELVMRASGRFLNRNQLPVSPQTFSTRQQ